MEVYYGHNFWYHKKEGKPLKKLSVHKAEEPLLKWENAADRELLEEEMEQAERESPFSRILL